MNNNQSIVKNLLKSTLESERLKLLSELKLVHSANRLFAVCFENKPENVPGEASHLKHLKHKNC